MSFSPDLPFAFFHVAPYRAAAVVAGVVGDDAKARLGKRFVASKREFKAALLSIMRSIQRSTELLLSFFQLADTQYAAHAGC
jgi:hypothetical protein